MQLLLTKQNALIEVDFSDARRLLALGLAVRPTLENMRAAAKQRGLAGWHNMKEQTLMERLENGKPDTS